MGRGLRFFQGGVPGVICFFLLISCASARDRVYGGRVIDFETKEPVEGAVVVAYWLEGMSTPAGRDTRLKEVKETLTDKNGQWSIVAEEHEKEFPFEKSFLTQTYYTMHPMFIIFKPGYCSWPEGFSIDACKGKMKPGGAGKIVEGENVELPKLTKKEDRRRVLIGPIRTTDEGRYKEILKKQKNLIKIIDEERKYLGLKEYKYEFLEE